MFKRLIDALRKKHQTRLMLNELNRMTDKELNDIGISRYMIRDIVQEATYGYAK